MNQYVPQSEYTQDYFEHCCEGFTADGTPGRRISTLLAHAGDPSGKNVIDVGCGRGEVARVWGKDNFVLSIDYAVAAAKMFMDSHTDNDMFLRADVSNGFAWIISGYFDIAVLADVVEHLHAWQMSNLGYFVQRVIKAGGLILIDTPIMKGGESKLHVDIKESWEEVHDFFPNTELVGTNWYKKPEHCNIILRKT